MIQRFRNRRRSSPASSAGRNRLTKVGVWLTAVLAAALTTAIAGALTGAFDALSRAVTGTGSSTKSIPAPTPNTSETDPLAISVDPYMAPCGEDWVVPQPPEQLDTSSPVNVDMMRSWRDWSPAATGVSTSPDNVLIFVQGRSNAQVILTGLKVRVHERRPPLAGTRLSAQCGDAGAFRWLQVDLDQNPSRPSPRYDRQMAEGAEGFVPDWQLQPIRFPYKVSLSEAEPFLIVANTEMCDCTWDVELTWATQGRTGTNVIDNNGVPFRTTSTRDTVGGCDLVLTEVHCG